MTRMQRLKKWSSEHAEAIAVVTLGVAGVTLIVVGVKADIRYNARQQEKHQIWVDGINAWVEEQRKDGHTVFPLYNGNLLSVPDATTVKVRVDTK